ncbi:uncharacterized protein LOC110446680 [Mizuhopecten yessoensis]|uniref:uncharacterized protein LOC110446680 n=1 Tax=Mizuhopecten yessoensis TaxID=6573 RepID=UPI000B458828|nr:uncharacterized protein LOC110446680 [Mizuhopecten yessoensis]
MLRSTRRAIFLMILYQLSHLQVTDAMCPVGGAMYYGPDYQMCFYVVIEPDKTFSAKQAACSRLGGVLSHIPDANANSFLFAALSEMSHYRFVLGLNDIANEGVFVTTAGNVQLWINWENNQPDNSWGREDCCEVTFDAGNSMVVNDVPCKFRSNQARALCHLENSPELPAISFGGQSDVERNAFSRLQSPSKGIVGAQLQNVLIHSRSMCALLCRQDDNCQFFVFTSPDAVCRTYAIPVIKPTADGAPLQIGRENVWVRR